MFWSEDPTSFDTSDLNVQITVSMKSVAVVDGKVEEVSETETLPIGNLFALTANSASELEYTEAGEYTMAFWLMKLQLQKLLRIWLRLK